jgi:hypothetical protein
MDAHRRGASLLCAQRDDERVRLRCIVDNSPTLLGAASW